MFAVLVRTLKSGPFTALKDMVK